ncbi:hypothetical protein HPP92_005154 [Vanilla planifolia]|uniref:Uncharacterized protein n=1 Tax=Vanilla planifolia TaxID=51239 RepID=A0A835VCX9_VANPL|nr:hypothetical protein HPP92_005154 [Vanilla planifolia]
MLASTCSGVVIPIAWEERWKERFGGGGQWWRDLEEKGREEAAPLEVDWYLLFLAKGLLVIMLRSFSSGKKIVDPESAYFILFVKLFLAIP